MRLFGVPQDSPCVFTNKGNLPQPWAGPGVRFIPTQITTAGVPTYRIADANDSMVLYIEDGSLKSWPSNSRRSNSEDFWLVVPRLSESNFGGNGCNGFDIVHYRTGLRLEVKNG